MVDRLIKEKQMRLKNQNTMKEFLFYSLFIVVIIIGFVRIQFSEENRYYSNKYIQAGIVKTYEDYIGEIVDVVDDEAKAKIIIDNIQYYPMDVLDILVNNRETLEFVLGYLTYEHSSSLQISLTKPEEGTIPLYLQWDSRWGYEEYGDNIIAVNGCGPTCLSMVAVGLLKDTSLNPKEIAKFSEENAFYESGSGTIWTLMSKGAQELGLKSKEIERNKNVIVKQLKKGHPIIASMGPGDFTTQGHFIVLTGVNEEGMITVNDPNSITRSNSSWDINTIIKQSKSMWAFSVE